MKSTKHYTVLERHTGKIPGEWFATVAVRGTVYQVALLRSSTSKRIAFRGRERGWHWYGKVTERDGLRRTLYDGQVTKSTGLISLLENAGLIPLRQQRRKALESNLQLYTNLMGKYEADLLAARKPDDHRTAYLEGARRAVWDTMVALMADDGLHAVQKEYASGS